MSRDAPFETVNAKIKSCTEIKGSHLHLCAKCNFFINDDTVGNILLFRCGHLVHARCYSFKDNKCYKCAESVRHVTLCSLDTLHTHQRIAYSRNNGGRVVIRFNSD